MSASKRSIILKSLTACLLLVMSMLYVTAGNSWLQWRGPEQTGVSREIGTPEKWQPGGENHLWDIPLSGGGTPIVAGMRLYVMGMEGEEPDIREVLYCINRRSGKTIWKRYYSDFVSDIIYNRYAIGSPAVDAETGNIYIHTSPGLVIGLGENGNELWRVSMMEQYNRLTFPNGRTGGPIIDGDLVIIHGITANWGSNAPARDRFYAFDKYSGELVWYSTPAIAPKDSSFSTPIFGNLGSRRVLYAGTGCGNVICIDARTGESLWRFQFSYGGVNSSLALHGKDKLIAIHGKENIDASTIGRMIALKIPTDIPEGSKLPLILNPENEIWRNDSEAFTSSLVIKDDTIYTTVKTGELRAVDANTGKIQWAIKLGPDQIHASPIWADNKLYVPMFDGKFYIVRDDGNKGTILSETHVEGNLIGAPSLCDGRIYLLSQSRLYAFGKDQSYSAFVAKEKLKTKPVDKKPAKLQIVPAEFAIRQGQSQKFNVYALNAAGQRIKKVEKVSWSAFVPPTAKVKSKVDGVFKDDNLLIASGDAQYSAGAFKAEAMGLSATVRGRITPNTPLNEDFEDYKLVATATDGKQFAYPPLPWLGARIRWQIIEEDGNKIIRNTLDRVLFQRSMNFIGSHDMTNYTIEADVKTDGNRRIMSNVGVINQRYNISLVGNWQALEIVSNHDRFKHSVPFKWSANKWYRIKSRVDLQADGSGTVRAKAWPVGQQEPAEWTIEATHKHAHQNGAPGLFAFSPQSQKSVYIDNITITPNE